MYLFTYLRTYLLTYKVRNICYKSLRTEQTVLRGRLNLSQSV